MMGEEDTLIRITGLAFKPIGADSEVLRDIDLELRRGEFVLLLGPPASGKSTLAYCLDGIIPHLMEGEMRGSVLVGAKETADSSVHELAAKVGIVFQSPDDQIVSLKVVNEVAWGLENLGYQHEEIVRRVDRFMDLLGISQLRDRLTIAISGGQKQKVVIASNLAMLQDVLVLDDPTTDLDPVCKAELVQVLGQLHREMGLALVVIEHDLNDLIELATRVVVMDSGHIAYDGPAGPTMYENYEDLLELGVNIPQHVEIANEVARLSGGLKGRYPLKKEDAFESLRAFVGSQPSRPSGIARREAVTGQPVIAVSDLWFSYREGTPILRGLNFEVDQGEFVAIIGANGSGKSTLVKNLTGLLSPGRGKIMINGNDTSTTNVSELAQEVGYVFQNPDHQLFSDSVAAEVGFSLRARNVPELEAQRRIAETLEVVGLGASSDKHPFSLSRGQRQKLAVATALIHEPSVILLDEPTTGQDRRSLSALLDMMGRLNRAGKTTVMVTHDMDIVAAYATRVLVMDSGQIVFDGHPEDVFYDRFDALSQLQLRPPTVVDFCRRLQNKGVPRFLTVEGLVGFMREVNRQDE